MPVPQERKQKWLVAPITKSIDPQSNDFVITGYFTSDQVDATGDVITKDATQRAVGEFRKFPTLRLMHQPIPCGRVMAIGAEDGLEWNQLKAKIVSDEVKQLIAEGVLTAMSVGIIVKDAEPMDPKAGDDPSALMFGPIRILDYTLVEVSVVDSPANRDAVITAAPSQYAHQVTLFKALDADPSASAVLPTTAETTPISERKSMDEQAEQSTPVASSPQGDAPAVEAAPAVVNETPVESPAPEPVVEKAEVPVETKADGESTKEDQILAMCQDMQAMMSDMKSVMSDMRDQMSNMGKAAPVAEEKVALVATPETPVVQVPAEPPESTPETPAPVSEPAPEPTPEPAKEAAAGGESAEGSLAPQVVADALVEKLIGVIEEKQKAHDEQVLRQVQELIQKARTPILGKAAFQTEPVVEQKDREAELKQMTPAEREAEMKKAISSMLKGLVL